MCLAYQLLGFSNAKANSYENLIGPEVKEPSFWDTLHAKVSRLPFVTNSHFPLLSNGYVFLFVWKEDFFSLKKRFFQCHCLIDLQIYSKKKQLRKQLEAADDAAYHDSCLSFVRADLKNK